MKKISVAIIMVIAMEFISGYTTNYNLKDLHKILRGSKYYIYAYDDYKEISDRIKCSDFYIYNIDGNSINFVKKFGEEISIKDFDDDILQTIESYMKFKLTSKYSYDDYTMLFGYSQKINQYVKIENSKVNMQIYISENVIKIGSPLIFGYC